MNTQPKLRKSEQNRRLPPLGGFVQLSILQNFACILLQRLKILVVV